MRVMPASCTRPPERWTKPPAGGNKLNVDGAWRKEDGTGGALRDHNGAIIFSSCRFLTSFASPLEAEVAACMEGIALTLEWSKGPFILETDCLCHSQHDQGEGLESLTCCSPDW